MISVVIVDINTNGVIKKFYTQKDAVKFLKNLASENFGLEIKESSFSYKICHVMKSTPDGKLDLPEIGVRLWRSFKCLAECGKAQIFRPQTLCDQCHDKSRLDENYVMNNIMMMKGRYSRQYKNFMRSLS